MIFNFCSGPGVNFEGPGECQWEIIIGRCIPHYIKVLVHSLQSKWTVDNLEPFIGKAFPLQLTDLFRRSGTLMARIGVVLWWVAR